MVNILGDARTICPESMDRIAHLNAAFDGHYKIERELGAGGMATVYLAEDVKHRRRVAIKVLRDDLAASVGTERFLREIEIAAQLQHPNILPLLDSGESDGMLYYVMPFVEGQSLRQRLAREQELPVSEAVRLLIEIVDGLAYAHAHGVVHRDIKPDNIMLSGRHGLITDFGVARAVSVATGSDRITSLGVALGTPSYMSPEQASADPLLDHRTDIYAVGIVAYELLAGRLPFAGTSPQRVLAAHVMEMPDPLSRYRPGISIPLEKAVMRCLEKRPADRWQSADELLAVLEPLATPSAGMRPASLRTEGAPNRRIPWKWLAAGLVVIIGAIAAYRAMSVVKPTLAFGRSNHLTTDAGLQIHPAISPDGKFVAYAAGSSTRMRIFIRPVGGGRVIPLSDDTTVVETNPRWSPDGSQLLFLSNGGVSVAPALGGSSRAVVPPSAKARVQSADWSPSGTEMVYARGDSLSVQALDGKSSRFLSAGNDLHDCHWSPLGQAIACVSGNSMAMRPGMTFGNAAPSAIVLIPANGGAAYLLTDRVGAHQSPVWSRDGARLYFISSRDGPRDVYEAALDRNGHSRGPPLRLTTGLNAQSLSLSGDDRQVAYAVYSSRANIWSMPIPSGAPVSAEDATPLTSETQLVEHMRPSRDGQWLLFDADRNGRSDIYRMPLAGGQAEQLIHETFDVFAPDLSPDGHLLAYHSWRTGNRNIEVKPLDGGPTEIVTRGSGQESFPVWAPDGQRLAYNDQANIQIFVVTREAPGRWSKPTFVVDGVRPEWSPDGKTLAFASLDTTKVLTVPADGGRVRTLYTGSTSTSGVRPRPETVFWSADGSTLFFKAHDEGRASLWSVPAAGGAPKLLVRFPNPLRRSNRRDFSVYAKRFYFTLEDQQSNIWVADVRSP